MHDRNRLLNPAGDTGTEKRNAPANVALVTGGRRGIGRAIALAMAEAGFHVAVLDVVEDDAVEQTMDLLSRQPVESAFLRYDIGDLSAHREILKEVQEALGPVDCLINNAGIQVPSRGDMLDVTPETFDRLIGVNLRGTFFLTQEVARQMLAATPDGTPRSIVTITSSNAHLVSPEKSPYCISKAGLSMASRLFAVRLAGQNISVYEIRPGLIRTDMTSEVRDQYGKAIASGISPIARWGEPRDVGKAVATLATGGLPFSTGGVFDVDGGLQIARL